MKEARYVIRLAHRGNYTPADCEKLLIQARDLVGPLQGTVINLRISRPAIEFDLFCTPESELHTFLNALEPLGPVLTYRRLDVPPSPVVPAKVIDEARSLFNEERYWEVHEVLEGLWRPAKGAEKQLLQGWILVAAALVHRQKNESPVADAMLQDALRRLENQDPVYYGFNVTAFVRDLKKIIISKTPHFPTI